MRFIPRGPRPAALDSLKDGKTERERAREHFVHRKRTDGFKFDAYSDKAVKEALSQMYGGKCAYCEALYDATQPQDVEHYRPKGRIDNGQKLIKPAYWWLAAEWENLLPSCIHCNREQNQPLFDGTELKMGKGDRFPLADETNRAKNEGEEINEAPLLLNPCLDNPDQFIRFTDKEGRCIVEPVDQDPTSLVAQRARASIDIYGLNRATLVRDRSRYMRRIKLSLGIIERLARQLETAPPEEVPDIEQSFLDELELIRTHADGEDRYSGMARSLIDPVFSRLGLQI